MVDEMLVAQAEWLPQYADAIPAARERLKTIDGQDARLAGLGPPRSALDRGTACGQAGKLIEQTIGIRRPSGRR